MSTRRSTSSNSSSQTLHTRHQPTPQPLLLRTPAPHTRKQLKYILTGGPLTWYAGILHELGDLLEGGSHTKEERGQSGSVGGLSWSLGSARTLSTYLSILLGGTTILLFLFLVLLPRVRGVNPNYTNWRDEPQLAVVIPILTATIVLGWSFLVFTLCTWSSLGVFWSLVGSSGLYAFCFGLIGLIPVPDR